MSHSRRIESLVAVLWEPQILQNNHVFDSSLWLTTSGAAEGCTPLVQAHVMSECAVQCWRCQLYIICVESVLLMRDWVPFFNDCTSFIVICVVNTEVSWTVFIAYYCKTCTESHLFCRLLPKYIDPKGTSQCFMFLYWARSTLCCTVILDKATIGRQNWSLAFADHTLRTTDWGFTCHKEVLYFSDHKTHQTIRYIMIFSLDLL